MFTVKPHITVIACRNSDELLSLLEDCYTNVKEKFSEDYSQDVMKCVCLSYCVRTMICAAEELLNLIPKVFDEESDDDLPF